MTTVTAHDIRHPAVAGTALHQEAVPQTRVLTGFLPDQMARLYEQFCAPIITVSGTGGTGKKTGQPADK